MGGENSGRIAGFAIRKTVENAGAWGLRVGLAADVLRDDLDRICTWSVAGKEVASVGLKRINELAIEVSYVRRDRAGSSNVRCTVWLATSSCIFGGRRFWFHCPSCHRRTGSIFLVGPPFKCRVCLGLSYRSQRKRHLERLLAKAARLGRRLGGTGDVFDFGGKPKGMHLRTYERLVAQLENLECDFWGGFAVQFRFPGFENPDDLEENDLGYRKRRSYQRRNASQPEVQ
jgi:hypothetical protein